MIYIRVRTGGVESAPNFFSYLRIFLTQFSVVLKILRMADVLQVESTPGRAKA